MAIPPLFQRAPTVEKRRRLYRESVAREQAVVDAVDAASEHDGLCRAVRVLRPYRRRLEAAIRALQPDDCVCIAGYSYTLPQLHHLVSKIEAAEQAVLDANRVLYTAPEDLDVPPEKSAREQNMLRCRLVSG